MLYARMHSEILASAISRLNEPTKLNVLTYRPEHRQNKIRGAEASSLRYIEMLIDLVLQLITHLLGVAQQHLCVLFVEHWVVRTSISSAHGALHHNHCLALPDLRQVPPCQYVHVKPYGFARTRRTCLEYIQISQKGRVYKSNFGYQHF